MRPGQEKGFRHPEFDAPIEKMTAAARRFDAAKVRADQLAAASGAPSD
jgi:hypothetical protein